MQSFISPSVGRREAFLGVSTEKRGVRVVHVSSLGFPGMFFFLPENQ